MKTATGTESRSKHISSDLPDPMPGPIAPHGNYPNVSEAPIRPLISILTRKTGLPLYELSAGLLHHRCRVQYRTPTIILLRGDEYSQESLLSAICRVRPKGVNLLPSPLHLIPCRHPIIPSSHSFHDKDIPPTLSPDYYPHPRKRPAAANH